MVFFVFGQEEDHISLIHTPKGAPYKAQGPTRTTACYMVSTDNNKAQRPAAALTKKKKRPAAASAISTQENFDQKKKALRKTERT